MTRRSILLRGMVLAACLAANAASAQGSSVLRGTWVADMTSWDWGTATMQITNVGRDGAVEGSVNFGNGYGFVFGPTLEAKPGTDGFVSILPPAIAEDTPPVGLIGCSIEADERLPEHEFVALGIDMHRATDTATGDDPPRLDVTAHA